MAQTINITAEWEKATGLKWNPVANYPNSNISVSLLMVNKSSGITSPARRVIKSTISIHPVPNPTTDLYYY